MKRTTGIAALLLGLALATGSAPLTAQESAGPGTKIDTLTVGATIYRQVQVRSVNAHTVMFTHAGGMASVHLRDLSPEWQERFHYDPAADAAADEAARNAPPPAPVAPRMKAATVKHRSAVEAVMQAFGTPAEVKAQVDLRPTFFKLELGVKNQGHRPSCAVFAVVSALEFQNAELTGKVEKFSEEYLLWAVRKSLHRLAPPGVVAAAADDDNYDEGFALSEVLEALRAYGIPLQSSMPNTFGSRIGAIEEPAAKIVQEAREHQKVFVHALPGRDGPTRVNNIVLALNAGLPVPVGMAWPNVYLPHGFISGQKPTPNTGHAVTIVGYISNTQRIDDTVFIFKNSWGPRWGQGGYGTVTYDYLQKNLNDGILLEVQAGDRSS